MKHAHIFKKIYIIGIVAIGGIKNVCEKKEFWRDELKNVNHNN